MPRAGQTGSPNGIPRIGQHSFAESRCLVEAEGLVRLAWPALRPDGGICVDAAIKDGDFHFGDDFNIS
ncbi:hypothetical protein BHQ18_24985 [Mycolicibacterium flavescens]|uniref:Uncharacterized protein n=1 Tax=Mycolicibacterium flavescens TaxID=1776 RepID=A0A1E3RAX7_MYCFV|nr:hypothetical protein BHQ18_24985 [Mycolicibacterium flavescens]